MWYLTPSKTLKKASNQSNTTITPPYNHHQTVSVLHPQMHPQTVLFVLYSLKMHPQMHPQMHPLYLNSTKKSSKIHPFFTPKNKKRL